MWVLGIAGIFGLMALLIALALIQRTTPSDQVEQRLKLVETEFAPTGLEGLPDVRKQELLSGVPWLNRMLGQLDLAARARILLRQADMGWSVGMLLALSLLLSVGTIAVLFLRLGSLFPALALGLLAAPLPTVYVLRRRAKRMQVFEEMLPEGLILLVSAIRVGHSFMTAIGYLAQESGEPLAGEFRKCFDEQNYGIDMRTAMMNLAERVPLQDIRIFIAAVLIHKESGGNLAEVLERVAATIRERFRLKKQVRVHTAQGRMTGWILALLPVVLGTLMYLIHPEGVSVLWTRPVGQKLLYTAAVMNVIGGLAIRKIVRIRI